MSLIAAVSDKASIDAYLSEKQKEKIVIWA